MVFTLRCFSVFVVHTVFPNRPFYLLPTVVLAHHLLVDRITSIHGKAGDTAVRSNKQRVSPFYQKVAYFYSLYQFLAIGSHLLPNARLGDLAYNTVIAIQSSAFMMTLYRKRIIRGKTHMGVYAFCLVLSYFHMFKLMGLQTIGLVVGAFTLRVNLPRSWGNKVKYAVWFLFLCVWNFEALSKVLTSFSRPEVNLTTMDGIQVRAIRVRNQLCSCIRLRESVFVCVCVWSMLHSTIVYSGAAATLPK
jgi:hypothetical protein